MQNVIKIHFLWLQVDKPNHHIMSFKRQGSGPSGRLSSSGGSSSSSGAPRGEGPGLQQRFKEMTAQERLIEQKKREFELKMMEEKRKQAEEAVRKFEKKKEKPPQSKSPIGAGSSNMPSNIM